MAKMVFRATPVTPAPAVRRRLAAAYRSGNAARAGGARGVWSDSSWLLREGMDMSEVDEHDAIPTLERDGPGVTRRPGGKG